MARDLNGSTEYFSNASTRYSVSKWSVSMWINIDSTPDYMGFACHDYTGSHISIWCGIGGPGVGTVGNVTAAHHASAVWYATSESAAPPLLTWLHYVFVHNPDFDSGRTVIYRNGKVTAIGTSKQTPLATTEPFRVGTSHGAGPRIDGRMSHVAVWDTALTGAEVLEVYRAHSTIMHTRPRNILGYWPMDRLGASSSAPDQSYYSSDLTLAAGSAPVVSDPPLNYKIYAYSIATEVATSSDNIDADTVLVDIQISAVEAVLTNDAAEILVDIQPSGVDGVTHFDAATILVDIALTYCEVYVAIPIPEFMGLVANKWSAVAVTQWSGAADNKWDGWADSADLDSGICV